MNKNLFRNKNLSLKMKKKKDTEQEVESPKEAPESPKQPLKSDSLAEEEKYIRELQAKLAKEREHILKIEQNQSHVEASVSSIRENKDQQS